MQSAQPRQPPGIPTGGEFASKTHGEPDVALSTAPTITEIRRGLWEVVNATSREVLDGDSRRVTLKATGFPEVRAHTGMVALRAERSLQTDAVAAELDHLASIDSKATVLVRRRCGDVEAIEGTLYRHQSGQGIAILAKGQRTKGEWLTPSPQTDAAPTVQVLAVENGYGKAPALADVWADQAAKCPRLEEPTFDDIPVWEGRGEPPREIAAAYVIDHPGFDGDQDGRGVVLFVTDRQLDPDDPTGAVLNGYMVVPGSSGMVSEHGSMYERDVAARGGRVAGFEPGSMTFRDAMDLGDRAMATNRPGPDGNWVDDPGDIEATWEALAERSRR